MTNAPAIVGKYPPTIQQRGIIAGLTRAPREEPSYHDMGFAFLISPRIDLRRLERTFAKLAERHDALRQSFERQGDDWFVNVWNRHRSGLLVEDHGDLNDADFNALLNHHSSIRIDLLDDVLFQFIVLKCGRRGDVLFIRSHHAVVDGHSMIVLVEDWLNLLIGIPLLGKGLTHEEYLLGQSKLSPAKKKENDKYWNRLLFPALPNPGLGQFGKFGERPRIVYRTDTVRYVTCSLSPAQFSELPVAVGARSQTPFSIVLAAYSDTIIELSGLSGIYVHTSVDRMSTKLRNYIGCGIVWPPVRCDASNGISLSDYASILSSQLKRSLVHLPSEAAWSELEYDLAIHEAGGLLRHFSCYITFASARAKKSPFSSGMMAGPGTVQKLGRLTIARLETKNQPYNFNGLRLRIFTFSDQIKLQFAYHSHFYSEKDIGNLLSGMQERLQTPVIPDR